MEIEVSVAVSQSLRCAFCHDDLGQEARYQCIACTAETHTDCIEYYGRCPVWACGTHIPAMQEEPILAPQPQRHGRSESLWAYTYPHIVIGSVTISILYFTQAHVGVFMLAIVAFMIMCHSDATLIDNEEGETP